MSERRPLPLNHPISIALRQWQPYYPKGYPIRDGIHNPWVVIDPLSGKTAYNIWFDMKKTPDADALRARLSELRHSS